MRAMTRIRLRSVGPSGDSLSWIVWGLLAVAIVFTTACSGSLFKVKPVTEFSPMPATVASANLGSITFRAAPMLSDEETQALFDSNLQLAGLLPVRVEIKHNGGEAVELKKVRFRLTDA